MCTCAAPILLLLFFPHNKAIPTSALLNIEVLVLALDAKGSWDRISILTTLFYICKVVFFQSNAKILWTRFLREVRLFVRSFFKATGKYFGRALRSTQGDASSLNKPYLALFRAGVSNLRWVRVRKSSASSWIRNVKLPHRRVRFKRSTHLSKLVCIGIYTAIFL